jgi:hypothetical protein
MKNLILASAVLLAMTACSSDDSNSTGGNGNEYSCNVSRNANTVVMDLKYRDFGEVGTVTLNSSGELPYHTDIRTFPTVDYAQRVCQNQKDDGYYKDIECYGNTVVIGELAKDGGLDYYESIFRSCCKFYEDQYKDGTLAEEYHKTYGG